MRVFGVTVCLFLLAASGCGSSGNTPTVQQEKETYLQQVGEMVRNYQMAKNKPPESLKDLNSVRSVSANGFDAVQSGKVVLRFGAALTDTKEEPGPPSSDEILAYEKETPTSGGQVIMIDRNIKSMTADEFKSAKLAGKSSSDAGAASAKK
jgi:hypothetical protein